VTDPIGSVRRTGPARRVRGSKIGEADAARTAREAQAAREPEAPAPIPPVGGRPEDPHPAIAAQVLGQADPAENDSQANAAQQARSAYLSVEWSGHYDRRTRRGRIAKTDV
jgi:hypothetical protein